MLLLDEGPGTLLGTVGAGATGTSFFTGISFFTTGGAGDAGDATFVGTVSAAFTFTSLAALASVFVGVEDAVAAGRLGAVASVVGGFTEATDAAGSGQR
jgi:hypothetical protein